MVCFLLEKLKIGEQSLLLRCEEIDGLEARQNSSFQLILVAETRLFSRFIFCSSPFSLLMSSKFV